MTTITVAVDASASLDYNPPVDGLSYLNFFTAAGTLTRNLVDFSTPLTVVGEPTFGNGYAEFKNRTNFLRSTVAQAAAGTLVAAARAVGVTTDLVTMPKFISNYSAGTPAGGGVGLQPRNTVSMSGLVTLNNGGAYQAVWTDQAVDFSDWAVWAYTWTAGQAVLRNLTTGTVVTTALSNPIEVSANRFSIGSDLLGGGTSFLGRSDILAAAIAPRVLTLAELTALHGRIRSAAARFGISV